MKLMTPIIIVGILILSGIGASALIDFKQNELKITEKIEFTSPCIKDQEEYITIDIYEETSSLMHPGEPIIPVVTKVYTFPFKTKINDVKVTFSDSAQQTISKKIKPAPHPINGNNKIQTSSDSIELDEVYEMNTYYPEKQWKYNIGVGLQNLEHVVYLSIQIYPVRYNPKESIISYVDCAEIKITYDLPNNPAVFGDEFDLVIIAPSDFEAKLQPLVTHKNDMGVVTTLITVEEITDEFTGRDDAEKMKYFIKSAVEDWGVSYVLIVGGRSGGVLEEKWWAPVRYSHLDDGSGFESSYLSDLYFADLYKIEENVTVFEDWDSNENDIFGEWSMFSKDTIDMYPDVIVGRLACRNTREVGVMVNKIIDYEETKADDSWFKNMVVVGGDSAPGDEYYEGEEENAAALGYMSDFTGVKLWMSDGTLTEEADVIDSVSEGCGFLFFDGHGNPSVWSSHPPNDEETWITGLKLSDMSKLDNREKLPICVVGGCHNAQFNVSVLNILKGILTEGFDYFKLSFYYKEWVPECWAWRMTRERGGGCLAIMGYTGLDWFAIGDHNDDDIPDCTQFYSGYCNTNFFKNYGVNDMTVLGQAHSQTVTDFITDFPPMDERLDGKTAQEFVLLGDPSLQIGGYE